jgi:uncharacterized protein (TIGR00369 family)
MSSHSAIDPQFRTRVRNSFERQGAMTLIGATLARIEPGSAEIHLPFRSDLTQQHGYFHAGMVTAIADSACGYAALSLTPAGSEVLSVEFKINLLRPASGERLVARAEVLRSGRTLSVTRADVYSESAGEATMIAAMQATMIVTPAR